MSREPFTLTVKESTLDAMETLLNTPVNVLFGIAVNAYAVYMALEHPDERGSLVGGAERLPELEYWLRESGLIT